jgi:hypothetical protein
MGSHAPYPAHINKLFHAGGSVQDDGTSPNSKDCTINDTSLHSHSPECVRKEDVDGIYEGS